jgi:hypothetical protein
VALALKTYLPEFTTEREWQKFKVGIGIVKIR